MIPISIFSVAFSSCHHNLDVGLIKERKVEEIVENQLDSIKIGEKGKSHAIIHKWMGQLCTRAVSQLRLTEKNNK
ncbi:hypothetical protein MKW98_031720, partial [Papaver atlanticum]